MKPSHERTDRIQDVFTSMKRKFFVKNMLLFILPMLIPLLLIGSVSIWMLTTYVKTEIDRRNMEQLSANAATIDSMISELERLNITLSANPSVRLRLKNVILKMETEQGIPAQDYEVVNTIVDLLYGSASFNPNIASLYVYFNNDSGWFISSSNRFSNLDFFFDTSWMRSYQEHINRPERYWFEFRTIDNYLFQTGTSAKVLTIYHKIYSSGKQEPDGILVLNVMENQLNKALAKLLNGDNERLFVLDANGQVVFQSHLDSSPPAVLEPGTHGSESVNSYTAASGAYRSYQLPSSLYDWQYLYLVPKTETYAVPDMLIRLVLAVCVIAGLFGLFVAYLLAVRNYGQIIELVNVIQLAKEGKEIPAISNTQGDLFHYVMQNVIRSFIQIDYLQVQLSERKYYAKTLELLALQSQLNPHFLYNTIQTILWKTIALTQGPNQASDMMERLSDVLHYALDDHGSMALLYDEIRITNSYIDIQKARYRNQFDVSWDISDVDPNIRVAKLMLQPLIENAIYHGIREKKTNSSIRISFTMKTLTQMRIRIIDDGLGTSPQNLKEIRKRLASNKREPSEHIGLVNTAKRLQLLYGGQASLFICSRQNHGTIITILLPVGKD